jgi:hypothetical protein
MTHEGDEMVAMAYEYESPTPALPADWEAIGRLVREGTLAAVAAHFEELAGLFEPADSPEPGGWESGGTRS